MSDDSRKRDQLGSMYERKPGVWELRKQCGRHVDGSPRIVRETYRGDRDAARAELYAMSERMGDTMPDADGMTVGIFFREYFAKGLRRQGRAEATVTGYESTYRVNIAERWGHVPLVSVTDGDVRKWVWSIPRPNTARKSYKLLKQVLRAAFDYGFLDEEPLRRRCPLPAYERPRPEVWGAHEVSEALHRLDGSRIEPVVLLMLGGGLRREEAMAVTMADVRWGTALGMDGHDALTAFVTVDKAFTTDDGLRKTKNQQSVRTVAVGEPFSSRLRACMPSGGPIVVEKDGSLADPNRCGKEWASYFRQGGRLDGLPRIKMMELRHTHATLMLASGVDPATTAKAHGHSTAVEYEHYLAPTDETMARAAVMVSREMDREA